jgi:glycosyltransferase involved in cell wall biosynthesis
MNLAVVSNHFAPYVGGIETQVRLVGEALARRGHRVTVLTRRYDRRLPWREEVSGLRVVRLRPSGEGVFAKWLMNLGACARIAAGRERFDVVLVNVFSVHLFGPALAGALRGIPIVIRTAQCHEFSGAVSADALGRLPAGLRVVIRRSLRAARAPVYRRARGVIATSTALAREAQAFGFPPAAIALVPNAVDTARFRPVTRPRKAALRAALGLPPDAEIAVCAGRLVRRKGLLTLVDAWAGVARDRPRALLLVVGGGPGPGAPRDEEVALRTAIAAYGLGDRVRLTGPVAGVERFLQASDVLVSASEEESFGNALVEAMACGLPVVSSRIEGAAADHVVEGVHGLKFDAGDARALRARLAELLASRATRAAMGAAGRAAVEAGLAVEPIALRYEQVLAACSEGGSFPLPNLPPGDGAGEAGARTPASARGE